MKNIAINIDEEILKLEKENIPIHSKYDTNS